MAECANQSNLNELRVCVYIILTNKLDMFTVQLFFFLVRVYTYYHSIYIARHKNESKREKKKLY